MTRKHKKPFCPVIALISIIIEVSSSETYGDINTYYSGLTGKVEGQAQRLYITCENNRTMTEAIPPLDLDTRIRVTEVLIQGCSPPSTSYVEEFQALHIDTAEIKDLYIEFFDDEPIPPGNYTIGLNITTLLIRSSEIQNVFENAQDFLEPLHSLDILALEDVQLPRIPATMQLRVLLLMFKSSVVEWGNCEGMEKLHLKYMEKINIPPWPEKCSRLNTLKLVETKLIMGWVSAEIDKVSSAAPHIINLELSSDAVDSLPIWFLKNAERLQYLNLSYNHLYDNVFYMLPTLKNLKTLDVSGNPLQIEFVRSVMSILPALRNIHMNQLPDIDENCGQYSSRGYFFVPATDYLTENQLEVITFAGTKISLDCFLLRNYKSLRFLDLSSTPTLDFELLDLPESGAKTLTIKFHDRESERAFNNIYFNQEHYIQLQRINESLHKGVHHNQWTLLTTFIDCDCKHGWLARALRDFPGLVAMPDLRCDHRDGVRVLQEDARRMDCDKWMESNTSCIFRRAFGATEIDAECRTGIVPKREHLRGLNVSSSGLTSFLTDLPESVQWIDYRKNHLSSANQTEVDALFLNGRRMWLKDNDIVCECHNRVLLDAIKAHSAQILDYDELTCIGTTQLINSTSTTELCQTSLKISLGVLGLVATLTVILTLTLRRHREAVSMFLYSRGWCLFFLQKEDLADKAYDAFVSYAHGDDSFVREVLVPGLENSPEKFRLCLHYRDWAVGGWIPAQIMHSVMHSKRTIIVLSRNFVESKWSAMEFRYALAKTSVEELPQVLILILDDVLEDCLSPELRGYLAFNTYLRCDDPWFWQKLRYAMPHRGNKRKNRPQQAEGMDPGVIEMSPEDIVHIQQFSAQYEGSFM